MKKVVYIGNFLSEHGFTPSVGQMLTDALQQEGYCIVKASNKKNKLLRLLHMLITIFSNRRNSVVIIETYSTTAFYFALACAVLSKLLYIKYIPSLHGGNLPERIKKHPFLSKQIFANSYTNIVISEYLQQCMHKNNWPSLLIQNPINIEKYFLREKKEYRAKLLWVRSFHEIYNPTLAIKILCDLRKTCSTATLTMVGPDRDGTMQECKELAKKTGVSAHVRFTGFLPKEEWIKLAESHDFFINTTNVDNSPVSVVEAMALGMVIISTNVGGIPYLISNNINGITLEPDNMQDFVKAIKEILENKERGKTLSRNARITAEGFSWSSVRNKWNQLLQQQEIYSN